MLLYEAFTFGQFEAGNFGLAINIFDILLQIILRKHR